jgi:hypothetical protein
MNRYCRDSDTFSDLTKVGYFVLVVTLATFHSSAFSSAQQPRSDFLFAQSPAEKITSLFRQAQISKLDLTAGESAAVSEIETWYFDGAERLAELSRSNPMDAELLLREQLAYETSLRAKAGQAETELLRVLGVERFDAAVRGLNREYLAQRLSANGQDKDAYLLSELLSERLELERDQLARLKEIYEERRRLEEQLKRKFLLTARELQEEKLDELLACLNSEQRNDYLEVVGKPIDWFRLDDPKGGIAAIVSAVKQGSTLRRVKSSAERDAARKEFAARGISGLPERFDAVVWLMLSSDLIRRECEVTREQESELELLAKAIRSCCEISSEQSESRKQQLLNGEFPGAEKEVIATVLLPGQLAWLRRAELQLRLSLHFDTFGLSDPAVIARFQLSASQLKELREVARQFANREQQMLNETNKQVSKSRIDSVQAAFEVLSDTQRAKYRAWLGD